MIPDNAGAIPEATSDHLRQELRAPLTAVTARGHHLQRQLLRADGLGNLERDLMLGNLATMLGEVQRLGDRIEDLVSSVPRAPLPVDPDAPPADLG